MVPDYNKTALKYGESRFLEVGMSIVSESYVNLNPSISNIIHIVSITKCH